MLVFVHKTNKEEVQLVDRMMYIQIEILKQLYDTEFLNTSLFHPDHSTTFNCFTKEFNFALEEVNKYIKALNNFLDMARMPQNKNN